MIHAIKKPSELADPIDTILASRNDNPDDIDLIADYLDISVIVKIYREQGYNAEEEVMRLVDIAKNGRNTESMRAMKMLRDICDDALRRRAIMMGRNASVPGTALPGAGLPAAVESFEAKETTRSVRVTLQKARCELEDQSDIKEIDDVQEENNTEENAPRQADDDYYEDERGFNPDIFRPSIVIDE